jgi:hypothetical protein
MKSWLPWLQGGVSLSSKRLYAEGKYHADDQYFSGISQLPGDDRGRDGGGVLLELSLNELADVYELLPPALWRTLVQRCQIFHVV